MDDSILLIAILCAGLVLFWLAVVGIGIFVVGAGLMFAWAYGGGGAIGGMLMLALWIFAFPVMAVLALIVGIAVIVKKKFDDRKESH